MHFADIIIREIAAEGLEGITLDNLWGYLDSFHSEFTLSVDVCTKQFIWKILRSLKCVSFYVNPTEALDCKYPGPFDRRTWLVESEHGYFYQIPADFELFKLYPVEDLHECGSCQFFSTRMDVTEEIRTSDSLEELSNVITRWGNLLVIVASQNVRTDFLLGSRCNPREIFSGSYLILEAIAKYRFNGLPTTMYDGLASFALTPSSLWYARQRLAKRDLVMTQPYMSKLELKPMSSGVLLHHWRYYNRLPCAHLLMVEKIIGYLKSRPKQKTVMADLKTALALSKPACKRLVHFCAREGFTISERVAMQDCCSILTDKRVGDLSEEDITNFIQQYNILQYRPSVLLHLITYNPAAPSTEEWFAKFGRKKDRPFMKSDDADLEEDLDELDETYAEEGDRNDADLDESVAGQKLHEPAGCDDVSDVDEFPIASQEYKHTCTLMTYLKSMAVAPTINADESSLVQMARLLLSREMSTFELVNSMNMNYFYCRRLLRFVENLAVVRSVKRSSHFTFVLCRRLLTDNERVEYIQNFKKNKVSEKTPTFSVQTQRQRRHEFLLKYFETHPVVTSVSELRNLIWIHEAECGMKTRMDYKSLHRIIQDLINTKAIVVHNVSTVQGDMRFLCHPRIEESDQLINEAIQSRTISLINKRQTSADRTLLDGAHARISDKSMQLVSLGLCACPRMRRRLLLHEYMYYVIHSLKENMEPIHAATDKEPAVYVDEYSWRRHVCPTQPPTDFSHGWFSFNEIVYSMPLGLFLHLASPSRIPRLLCRWLGLNQALRGQPKTVLEHLDEQLKANPECHQTFDKFLLYPVNRIDMPGGSLGRLMRWVVSTARIRAIYNVLEEMTIQNLVTLYEIRKDAGKTFDPEKIIGFLHLNASLLDTRTAAPGFRVLTDLTKCDTLAFHFESEMDVSAYWQSCEMISKLTPLGHRSVKTTVDSVSLPLPTHLPGRWIEGTELPVDDGSLPILDWSESQIPSIEINGKPMGPCGACGFHPSDFNFLSRNWDVRAKLTDRRTINGQCDKSDQDESSSVDRQRIWDPHSTDRVPLHPLEPFWQWSERLFEDANPQTYTTVMGKPSEEYRTSSRKYGFFTGEHRKRLRHSKSANVHNRTKKLTTKPTVNPDDVNLTPGSLQRTALLDNFLRVRRRILVRQNTKSTKYLSLKRLKRHRLLDPDDKKPNETRPRSKWSPPEDLFLVVCRVASQLVGGCSPREYMCFPYVWVTDLMHKYNPEIRKKSSYACSRRLRFILFQTRSYSKTNYVLSGRVAGRQELHRKYHCGRVRWLKLVRDHADSARALFEEAVGRIVYEFVPRLRQSCSDETARVTDVSNVEENQSVIIQGSRAEVEKNYTLFALNAQEYHLSREHRVISVDDVARNRVAVVIYTLYMYAHGSFRLCVEPSCPFRNGIFAHVMRQYPRLQVHQAVLMLSGNHVTTIMKANAMESDHRIMNAKRIKMSGRYETWVQHELVLRNKYFSQSLDHHTNLVELLSLSTDGQDGIGNVSGDDRPLINHSFETNTNGGTVAFFTEMLLLESSVQMKMNFVLNDISFIGIDDMKEAIDFYTKQKSESGEAGKTQEQIESNEDASASWKSYKGIINRVLLQRVKKAPDCFADPSFWYSSGYNNRFRWFDRHLSFVGGHLSLYKRTSSSNESSLDRLWCHPRSDALSSVLSRFSHTALIDSIDEVDQFTDEEQNDLEKYIMDGHFTGRTAQELKTLFGDTDETESSMNELFASKKVYWLGSSISRFVHRRYIRLWMIHIKSISLDHQLTSTTEKEDHAVVEEEEEDEDEDQDEPVAKRICTSSSKDITPESESQTNSMDSTKDDDKIGFFFPEPWLSEIGRLKPRAFCAHLQALMTDIIERSGTPLNKLSAQHQIFFGQQFIRRLVFLLRDLGAVRLQRIIPSTVVSLFSPNTTFTISENLILSSDNELTCVPSPNCVSIVGAFCRKIIQQYDVSD